MMPISKPSERVRNRAIEASFILEAREVFLVVRDGLYISLSTSIVDNYARAVNCGDMDGFFL